MSSSKKKNFPSNDELIGLISKLSTENNKITEKRITKKIVKDPNNNKSTIKKNNSSTDVKLVKKSPKINKSPTINKNKNFYNIINPDYWILPNRKKFINWIDLTFLKYKARGVSELSSKHDLFLYQQFIKDYIQINSPYRGLLLYHGLGSGKTCSSIAVAEAMKDKLPKKSIIVMLPASLEPNYIDELMKCGDEDYKIQQHWEKHRYYDSLPISSNIIIKHNGLWVNNPNKTSNYTQLSESEKNEIKLQLNAIIKTRYEFIHYNGLRNSTIDSWDDSEENNYFSNKVIIVDEVHNLISMIVGGGQIGKKLYNLLMNAQNSRFVLLSGTPIINYPHEAAFLFNLLRGYIYSYKIKLSIPPGMNEANLFNDLKMIPYVDQVFIDVDNTVNITKNNSYFQNIYQNNNYRGVKLIKPVKKIINHEDFISILQEDLKQKHYYIRNHDIQKYTCLPEKREEFEELFLTKDGTEIKNKELFKRRILGTVSYYKGAKAHLLPKKIGPHIIECVMSPHQTKVYKQIRSTERDKERVSKRRNQNSKGKKDDDSKISSYYRVFSRATCNFVFPEKIERPFPTGKNKNIIDEDEGEVNEVNFNSDDYKQYMKKRNQQYEKEKEEAFSQLDEQQKKYLHISKLEEYSEKFKKLYQNLEKSPGTSFIYSQFRTLEGIGILSLVLLANGYAEYKISYNQSTNEWYEDISKEDYNKPKFAFYTGTEDQEHKDIIKKIFNNDLQTLSPTLRESIEERGSNLNGNIIKILLATSSAAEGITLANVRQVHIIEPYWNPVRIQQVIGRAVRIRSHFGNDTWSLSEKDRNVEIFIYISVFDKKYFQDDYSWLRLDNFQTSDQKVFEIANNKKKITDDIFQIMKEAAVDCELNSQDNEDIKCFTFGNIDQNNQDYSYIPNIGYDNREIVKSQKEKSYNYQAFEYKGNKYYLNRDTNDIYDYESVKDNKGRRVRIGKLVNGKITFL